MSHLAGKGQPKSNRDPGFNPEHTAPLLFHKNPENSPTRLHEKTRILTWQAVAGISAGLRWIPIRIYVRAIPSPTICLPFSQFVSICTSYFNFKN